MTRQAIEMNKVYLLNVLLISSIVSVSDALSAITSTPGIQRKSVESSSTFQWTVTTPLYSYNVYNLTTGNPLPLSANAKYNEQNGIVTLTIWNIQLWDAGNYSLSVNTGTRILKDSSALLFVYGSTGTSVSQTFGSIPATQGETVELTCTATSTSLPDEYRPKIYYHWYISRFYSYLKNISSGPAILRNGDLVSGYSIKNGGSTLVIDSAEYPESVQCNAQEEGAPELERYPRYSTPHFTLQLYRRPYTTSRTPNSGIVNALIGDEVSVDISGEANAGESLDNKWAFVDAAGRTQDLPNGIVPSFHKDESAKQFNAGLRFRLSSEQFYGKYSLTLANSIGSLVETIQVRPAGRPDAPSDFRVVYASHSAIKLRWFAMSDNGDQQTIFLEVNSVDNEETVAMFVRTLSPGSFNESQDYTVSDNIQPESHYDARIWSINELGTSEVVKLTVTTQKQPALHISAKTISVKGSNAIINYSTSNGNITHLFVFCSVELTGVWSYNEIDLRDSKGQVIFNNLPDGNGYVCSITAYGGSPKKDRYYATSVSSIRVSRTRDHVTAVADKSVITIIVLSTALGLIVLALIGCTLAFLVPKCRGDI